MALENSLIERFAGILFITGVILIVSSCETPQAPDTPEPPEYRFSYEIYDENGAMLRHITHEQIDEVEIETSLGLFGEEFLPPFFTEHPEIDSLDLSQHEIYLHAEKGISEDVHFVTLNFKFPMMDQWQSGTYEVGEFFSRERWLEILRKFWELLQEHEDLSYTKQNPLLDATLPEIDERLMIVNYNERIQNNQGTSHLTYLYLPTDGFLELTNVSEDRIEGNFEVEMSALPADILTVDVFPENPKFQGYRIIGDFVAEYGDHHDLAEARADFFGGQMNAGTLFGF